MEQKSRNSMFRILDDTGGPAVQAAFYESLKECDCLHLTKAEEHALEVALEVSRVGQTGYTTNLAMQMWIFRLPRMCRFVWIAVWMVR